MHSTRTFLLQGRHRLFREAIIIVGLLGLTCSQMTAILTHIHTSIPSDPIDPLYNVWGIALSLHQFGSVLHNPTALFDSNTFYPARHAAMYGDVFIGLLPLSVPLHYVIPDPVALTNILVVLSFVLSGYGAFLLGRQLTESTIAGLGAAIVFAGAPVRFAHAGHLTVQSSEWLVFGVWALCIAWKQRSFPWWITSGILLGLASITNLYCVAYLSIPAVIVALVTHRYWTRQHIYGMLAAGCIALLITAPLVIFYLLRHAHLPAGYGANASTDVISLLIVFKGRLLDALLFPSTPYTPLGTLALFPGGVVIGLTLLGLYRSRRLHLPVTTIWGVFGCCTLVIALGDHLVIAGHNLPIPLPWQLLSSVIAPLSAFRSPAQALIGLSLALSVLSAYGIVEAQRAWGKRSTKPVSRFLPALVMVILAAELWQPLPAVDIAPLSHGSLWLAQHDPGQPALALPLHSRTPQDWMEQTRIMYDSTASWIKLVNGQASVVPDGMQHSFDVLSTYPSLPARHMVKRLNIHLIIAYISWLPAWQKAALARHCNRAYSDSWQWICRI